MNLEQARYMVAVYEFLSNPDSDTDGLLITDRCPECGDTLANTPLFEWDHGVIGIPTPEGEPIVVIGCEGYRVVDPNRVGIKAPDWEPTPAEK